MSVEPVRRSRTPSVRLPRWRSRVVTLPALLLLSLAPLLAGADALLPAPVAVAASVVISATVHSGLLIRLAWHLHTAASLPAAVCRGAGFTGLGVLSAGAAVTGALLLDDRPAAANASAAGLAAVGLLVCTLLYLVGLLLMPGVVPGSWARTRRLLDGSGLGVCFGYTAWLLAGSRAGTQTLAVGVALTCFTGLAIAIVTGLGATRHRWAALTCAGGAALSMVGVAAVTVVLESGGSPRRLMAAAVPVVLGPAVSHAAAWYTATRPQPAGNPGDDDSLGYPLLVVPVGGALAATAYHVASGHRFDAVAILLAVAAAGTLAARETFAHVDLRRLARRAVRREAHFRSLIAGSMDVTVVLDDDLVVRWQSPAAARLFGLSDQDVMGRPFVALVHPGDAVAVRERLTQLQSAPPGTDGPPALLSARLRDGFGTWRQTESTVSDQRSVPEVGALVLHLRDIGQRAPAPVVPATPTGADPLTGLADRRQLARTVAGMRSVPGRPGALLLIELDEVAAVAEVHGPQAGEAVLVEVGRRLRAAVAGTDLAARLMDEVFAVATANPPVPAYALAARVRDALREPFALPGTTIRLTANIGLAELSGAASVGDALSRAEAALSRARQLRSGGIEWYDEAMANALQRRRILERELPGVVHRGELDLVYEPVLELSGGVPVGADALLRWRHPRLGTVSAADLVPVAEAADLVEEIGGWLLHQACRQLARWLEDGWDLWLGVQLAAGQLTGPALVDVVAGALRGHDVPAERLVLEVTEQSLGGGDLSGSVAQLGALRSLGVRTALVQYGTGTTPLASLRRLPVDLLKVDRTVFTSAPARPEVRIGDQVLPHQRELPPGGPLMDAVVGLGRRLGMQVIAEGLDVQPQADLVRAAGCRYGQGRLFGSPAPAERFEAYLEAHGSRTA